MFSKKDKSLTPYSIFSEFTYDLRNLNLNDFRLIGEETNESGTVALRYLYSSPLQELETPFHLEFIEFKDGVRSFFFSAFSTDINYKNFSNLINRIHKSFGQDMFNYKSFELSEVDLIKKNEYWSGRMWTNINPEIMIEFNTELEMIMISILRLKKKFNF